MADNQNSTARTRAYRQRTKAKLAQADAMREALERIAQFPPVHPIAISAANIARQALSNTIQKDS